MMLVADGSSPAVTVSCAFCAFETRAPVQAAHAAFTEHECSHPRPKVAKRKRARARRWFLERKAGF
jgi:hypothetical protein